MTNAAIADRLGLAEGTMCNYVTSILAKQDVADRAYRRPTAVAWRCGLVSHGEVTVRLTPMGNASPCGPTPPRGILPPL